MSEDTHGKSDFEHIDDKLRLATVENDIKHLAERIDMYVKREHDQLDDIRESIKEIKTQLDNNKGFIRGIVYAVTAIIGGAGLVEHYFLNGNPPH